MMPPNNMFLGQDKRAGTNYIIHSLTHLFIHPAKSVVCVYHAGSTVEGTGDKEV